MPAEDRSDWLLSPIPSRAMPDCMSSLPAVPCCPADPAVGPGQRRVPGHLQRAPQAGVGAALQPQRRAAGIGVKGHRYRGAVSGGGGGTVPSLRPQGPREGRKEPGCVRAAGRLLICAALLRSLVCPLPFQHQHQHQIPMGSLRRQAPDRAETLRYASLPGGHGGVLRACQSAARWQKCTGCAQRQRQ